MNSDDSAVDVGVVAGILRFLVKPVSKLWRSVRFGARVDLSHSWRRPLLSRIGDPIRRWRAVKVEVVAAKHEEFVVSGGELQLKQGREWIDILPLREVISLPWEIRANRSAAVDISGETIAKAIQQCSAVQSPTYYLRAVVRDHHRQRARSEPLLTSLQELLRQEVR